MKIVPIHYKVSHPVKNYFEIEDEAVDMEQMIDAKNFKGLHRSCYALGHCQVNNNPYSFFVLDKQLVEGMGEDKNVAVFEDRTIINPKILEAPVYYADKKLLRAFRGSDESNGKELIPGKKPNSAQYMEGCMSFPFRKGKKINRFNKIKVTYQIKGRFRLKKCTRWLEGLPSQVFQHEFDHCQGQNIFFGGHKK